jgi:hypothetical protein
LATWLEIFVVAINPGARHVIASFGKASAMLAALATALLLLPVAPPPLIALVAVTLLAAMLTAGALLLVAPLILIASTLTACGHGLSFQ